MPAMLFLAWTARARRPQRFPKDPDPESKIERCILHHARTANTPTKTVAAKGARTQKPASYGEQLRTIYTDLYNSQARHPI